MAKNINQSQHQKKPNLLGLLKPYKWLIVLLISITFLNNGLNLMVPKIIASGLDAYTQGSFVLAPLLWKFSLISLSIFVLIYLQSIFQTYTAEKAARDLRYQLINKISEQSYAYVQKNTSAKLLTNLTSDVDAVKMFISQAVVVILSSIFLIIGASFLLLSLNWRLGLAVLIIVPIIGVTFFLIMGKIRPLFLQTQGVIDRLNKVINESIIGSALIRVFNSSRYESDKFVEVNTNAKNIGLQILRYFSIMIPIINLVANLATLTILVLGGQFVINSSMTLGSFTAFNSYLGILIFPIIMIGFMSNVIARSSASYSRISQILESPDDKFGGTVVQTLKGNLEVQDLSLSLNNRPVLKNISFKVEAGQKTAIIGPTAAGKTQLLYLLTGLTKADFGTIKYDNHLIQEYDSSSLHHQVGFVFQDSIIFNLPIRENISFSESVTPESLQLAIETAELDDFIDSLPRKLNTVVSERGTSLSGGQKQRIMLARALALNPKILLLDDFTARVDTQTEQKILKNVAKNYPDLTLISVTQKISSVKNYDQIIVLMEGEIIAKGTHDKLLKSSPEYVQLYKSQKSTSHYEL